MRGVFASVRTPSGALAWQSLLVAVLCAVAAALVFTVRVTWPLGAAPMAALAAVVPVFLDPPATFHADDVGMMIAGYRQGPGSRAGGPA
ncbi:MAG: hypothetical protein ABWY11_11940 [Umezawaea sp.]